MKVTVTSVARGASDIASKWGMAVAERGFTQVPNYLIRLNTLVHEDHKLPPSEMVILLQLVATWWRTGEMPFPSMATLASRAYLSERQVQRALKSLEEKGFLKKVKGKVGVIASNSYDLSPLIAVLGQIAEHYVNQHPRKIKKPPSSEPADAPKSKKRRIT